jgi:trans-aconitate methyltransferase
VPNRGANYDARFTRLAESGHYLHGEADLVDELAGGPPAIVVDAGCGTGRVAIELARRGYDVTGVDVDTEMLDAARRKEPELDWRLVDLASPNAPLPTADVVVAAGNVMVFVEPGTEGPVISTLVGALASTGLLITGFQVLDRLPLDHYDDLSSAAGLELVERWGTWHRDPYTGGDYVVSIHRRRPRDR